MTYQHILFEVKEKIAWLTFNRPEQLNAMNAQMMNEIIHALGEINVADPKQVRVGVITGAGKAFMAGADIKEYAMQTQAQFEDFQTRGYSVYSAIEGNAKPVIAAINGYAFGGGLEIALACDMIVAVEGAKMGLPEINLNLIPGGGGTGRLSKKIGVNLANEMIMSGRTVLAEEMHFHGLVNYLYPKDVFIEKVAGFAASFADKAADRLQIIKQLTQMSAVGVELAAQSMEKAALNNFYQSKEGQEKIQEFYQKSLEKKK
ncbi:MAG: enoyl-CoA hydratase/isomerase family protein [Ferruginibacter sp.]